MSDNLQKDYIRKIKDITINPIQCSNNYFNKTIQKYVPGKRYILNKYSIKDYLTVASNQIIFELDAKAYNTNYEISKKIINVLKEREMPYYIFSSGGKGIHIEIWFTKPEMERQEFKDLFTESLSYGLSFKHIRFWLWNKILDEAGLDDKLRGIGKIIDSACMNFDDLNHKTRLLRVCGGRKIYINKLTNKEDIYYKTFILKTEFNKTKIKIKDFNQVNYPSYLESYKLNPNEFSEFLQEFIKNAQTNKQYQLKKIDLSKNKGYIGLDSVQKILEGLSTGNRSVGAQVLSIAMANDKIDIIQQEKIMKTYVDNCSQIGDPFNLEEAMGWVKWVSQQKDIFWNCELTKQLDIHNNEVCNYCKQIYKDANKLLIQTTILNQIEELLSIEIKGEVQTKILIFLLMLSKDFPSKTGEPGWNIQGDPMSQNIILSSDSSSGKSWITKRILEIFGEKNKDYFVVSRYTKSVLNYYTEINMDNKIVFIEELQGLDESTNQLRVWMSEGELNLETVEKIKDEEGNEVNQKVTRTTIGQPVFITNQAEGTVEDQLNNRSWVLSTDVSTEQTKYILEYQDLINKGHIKDIEEKKRQVQDALKQLKPYHFLIPYSNNELLGIPIDDVRTRRDYNKFMTLIKCSAYLHQKQRIIVEKNDKKFIICDLKDYDIAKKYSDTILGASFSGLTVELINILTKIKGQTWKLEFDVSSLMRLINKSYKHCVNQLQELCDKGFIIADKQGIGKATNYSINEEKALSVINLPLSKDIEETYKIGIKEILDNNFKPIQPSMIDKEILKIKTNNLNPKILGLDKNPIQKQKNNLVLKSPGNNIVLKSYQKKIILINKEIKILGLTCENVINIFKKSNKHILTFENIKEYFKCDNINLEKLLNKMKNQGDIIESKPNKYMLL